MPSFHRRRCLTLRSCKKISNEACQNLIGHFKNVYENIFIILSCYTTKFKIRMNFFATRGTYHSDAPFIARDTQHLAAFWASLFEIITHVFLNSPPTLSPFQRENVLHLSESSDPRGVNISKILHSRIFYGLAPDCHLNMLMMSMSKAVGSRSKTINRRSAA